MAGAIALVADLIFASRIRESAGPAGVPVRTARRPEALVEACRAETPALVLLDLDDDRLQPLLALRLLRGDPGLASLPVVGFVSHVNGARALEAQAAGCTRVMARGAFVVELPALMAEAAGR